MTKCEESEILRERLQEYRALLEGCYLRIQKTPLDTDSTILEALEKHGIGTGEVRPIYKKDYHEK